MKLFYFTASYPFGLGEQWKANELEIFSKHFNDITVIPFEYNGNKENPKQLPKKVKLAGPIIQNDHPYSTSKLGLFRIVFHSRLPMFATEFFRKKVYRKKSHIVSWFLATLKIIYILRNKAFLDAMAQVDNQSILYFFWGKGSCEALPFVHFKQKPKQVFVRFHRFDLFEYVNDGYIPYRKPLLNAINIAAPCAEAGRQHLQDLYPETSALKKVFRLGTKGNGNLSPASNDGYLRVVSCSLLSPVKRVHLMIEALSKITVPVIWKHIGGGPLENELKQLVKQYNLEGKFLFEGMLDSKEVINYYTSQPFDLFINTSKSEGVPVSIMEAFAAGIPVFATNVGGNSEIVNESNGQLLPENIEPRELANRIEQYHYLPIEKKAGLRSNAYNDYLQNWETNKNTNEVLAALLN